jgi:RIO kinase 1
MTVQSRERFKIHNNVFDEFTLRNLHKLASQGYFDELASAHGLGKEANIFSAKTVDGSYVIVKIYRLENCNFNKMYGYIKSDPRYGSLKGRRREIIFAWVQREFRNLLKAREVGVHVPTPIAVLDNIIVMELIGNKDELALQLKNTRVDDPKKVVDAILKQMQILYQKAEIVHADLSPFNILVKDEEPVIIDMSQSTSITDQNANEYLERDITNILSYAKRNGIEYDAQKVKEKITKKKTTKGTA